VGDAVRVHAAVLVGAGVIAKSAAAMALAVLAGMES